MTKFKTNKYPLPAAFVVCVVLILLGGCEGYRVSVNERTVYTPPPLLSGFTLEDKQLQVCVEQTVSDQKIHQAEELTQLNCSSAGITSLVGLATFVQLQQLNLADNNVQSLDPLTHLQKLRRISLKNNGLINIDPLQGHGDLRFLDLSGNQALECGQVAKIVAGLSEKLHVTLPEHCQQ